MDVSTVKSPPVPPKQESKRTDSARQAAEQTERNQAATKKAEQPKPSPVVNTQGQQTGRLLNVVA